ncbi:MAG: TonB-dependent receptor [Pseudomonadota bacterium]
MLHRKPLTLAVSAAIGAVSALNMAPTFAQDEELVEEVVVTGSRIQRANLVSSSPVTQLDNEQLKFTGLTRVEDALAAIPAISLDQSSGQAIEATGVATLQLRNLGVRRTLVLMNGRRLPAGTPSGGINSSAADINLIPGQLIERVEVLTGGASSTYGADAVAGVVNFIMQDDFEGLKIDYQFSQNRHDNDGNVVATAADAAGQPFATGTSSDGEISDFTVIFGGNFDNGRGNITTFGSYREIEGVTQVERDHSACPVRDALTCLGSSTNASGSIIPLDPNGIAPVDDFAYRVEGNQLLDGVGPGFNFAAPSYFQRPDERVTVGTFGHYDVNEHVEAYTELMFMDTKSTTQFGPAGNFFTSLDTNCGNPFLSEQQGSILGCTGDDPDQIVEFLAGRRNVEGGPRFGVLRHTTYRGVFGIRGDINDSWRYDVSWQYAEVDMRNRNGNYFDTARLDQALDAVLDDSGNVVCAPGADDGCVPYNLWNTGGVTDDQVAFLSQNYFATGTTSQEVFMAYAQGSLGDYGITSPLAENGVEVVIGAEYREETLRRDFSDNATRGVVGGLGAALVPASGRYDVNEFYFEAVVPLVEGASLAQSIEAEIGYRYSDYSFGPTTDTYKIAGAWAINDDVRLRASFNRAVRAPNVIELFEPINGGLFAMDADPCSGVVNGISSGGYTFEQCARSGVSQAIWDQGGPANNPASQYNQFEGGSTELEPEEADTITFGVIFTPSFIDGLTVSLDYYDIEIEGAIQGIAEETTLIQCIETGDPAFCDAVGRGINDTLWLGLAGPGNGIDARATNIGFLKVEGFDLEVNYTFDVGDMGTVAIANISGLMDSYEQEEFEGAGVVNCEGVYGGPCDFPRIDFQNRLQATWATPWDVTASLIWRHLGSVDQEFTSVDNPADIDSFNYFDIAATWDVTDYASLRFGINNLLDEEPPFVFQGVTARENGNTFPGIYDPLGQYLFAGFTVQF